MTNQLLLAQILAEGSEAAQNSNALPWGTWVSSVIGLLGSIIVAWWSGRKIDKQMAERQTTYNQVSELTSRIKQAAQQASL